MGQIFVDFSEYLNFKQRVINMPPLTYFGAAGMKAMLSFCSALAASLAALALALFFLFFLPSRHYIARLPPTRTREPNCFKLVQQPALGVTAYAAGATR